MRCILSPPGVKMTQLDRMPDFYLVGAPRCGTTALSRYLKHHPDVCFSRPKEPHYFSLIAAGRPGGDLRADYLGPFFSHYDPSRHTLVGEGSVSYLYARDAIEQIDRLNPRARFVVHVRNPLEMVPSHHARMLYTLDEDVSDFAAAWRLQELRERGERLPNACRNPLVVQYANMGMLGRHLAQLYDLVGRERVHVNVFDDFCRDPGRVYADTLDFLDLEHDHRDDFAVRQESRAYRSRWLHKLLYRPGATTQKLMLAAERAHSDPSAGSDAAGAADRKPLAKRLRKRLKRWNAAPEKPAPLSARLRKELADRFAGDVEQLSKLLDRDLRHWLE